jgi:hypothetical protein
VLNGPIWINRRKPATPGAGLLHKSIAIEAANAIRFCNPQARKMSADQIHSVNGRFCTAAAGQSTDARLV